MAVRVLFFAQSAAWAGHRERESRIEKPMKLSEFLAGPDFSILHGRLHGIRFAVNEKFADGDTWIRDGDELAFLPPMSGG